MTRRKNASGKQKQDNDRGSGKEEEHSSSTLERKEEEEYEDNEDEGYVVEINDPIKVKQAIDEAIIKALEDSGIKEDHFWCNIKMAIMTVACLSALTAQFILKPFPEQSVELSVLVALYFILTDSGIPPLAVKTSFDSLSEIFTLWVCDSTSIPQVEISIPFICPNVDSGDRHTKKELKVGNFFSYEGHFDEEGIEELAITTIRNHVNKRKEKKT